MSYVEENLVKGEQIVFRTHLYFSPLGAIFLGLLGLVFIPAGVIGLFFTLCFWLAALQLFIKRRTSEFVVTNKRVVIKVGWLSTRTVEMNLNKIETVAVKTTFLNKRIGDLIINGTGGGKEIFKQVENAAGFRKAVQESTDALHTQPQQQLMAQSASQ